MNARIAFPNAILLILLLSALTALLSFQASAGCGRWVIRENTDYLQDSIFDDAVKASTMSGPAVAEGNANGSDAIDSAANDSTVNSSIGLKPDVNKSGEEKPPVPDVSGRWQFELPEKLGGGLDLILIQSGDRLQGYGHVAGNGSQVSATATGTVSQDSVSLDVRTVKSKESRRLDLALAGNALEGSCELYEGDQFMEKGAATATRNMPKSQKA